MKYRTTTGIMLTLLFTGMVTLAFNIQVVKASETIIIMADGSVDPDTAPIQRNGNVYTLTSNIHDLFSIVVECDNIVVDGASYTIQGTQIFWLGQGKGIDLTGRNNVTIKNLKMEIFEYGVFLSNSSSNIISGNAITQVHYGIHTLSSSYNSISGNNITNNDYGIWLSFLSYNNSISGNNLTHNSYGVWLYRTSNNSISGNNITNNSYGTKLDSSSDNWIYHNDFVDNTQQVLNYNSTNVWDDGYPSGGNYWSDFSCPDVCNGPFQNETGSDGIGDEPYIIDENNKDRYPLVPYGYVPSPDVNKDGIVDITDMVMVALAFDSRRGDPNWNVSVDLNVDGIINMIDLVMVAMHFGETY